MSGWGRRIKLRVVPEPALCGGGRLDRPALSAALSVSASNRSRNEATSLRPSATGSPVLGARVLHADPTHPLALVTACVSAPRRGLGSNLRIAPAWSRALPGGGESGCGARCVRLRCLPTAKGGGAMVNETKAAALCAASAETVR